MDLAYAAADAVVCRAGSNTVTEVSGVGLPAIFVPLPIGNGEQAHNARPVVDAGGGLLVADAALTPEWVSSTVPDLLTDTERLATMSAAAANLIPLDADEKLADLVLAAYAGTAPMRVPVPDTLLPADQLGTVHFVGIGGAGLSGIARIMLARGITVTGSDAKESRTLEALRALGAHLLPRPRRRPTSATPTRSWSRPRCARPTPRWWPRPSAGCGCCPRSAALESVMQGRVVVAVAGTHGKTTTTSLLTVALQHCGADPSFAIGGDLNETGSNAHDGSGELFVAEADESDGAFLVYSPHAALVTNVEADHLDNYGTAGGLPGRLRHLRRPGLARRLHRGLRRRPGRRRRWAARRSSVGRVVVRVGESADADVRAEDVRFLGSTSTFVVVDRGRRLGEVTLQIPGRHYVLDALAALACGLRLGFAFADLARGLAAFSGTRRRMELKGQVGRRTGLRQLRPPPQRDRRRPAGRPVAGGRGPRRGRVPAAHGLAHPDLRPRHGRRARCRRRRRGDGHLRRARGPRARVSPVRWSPTPCRSTRPTSSSSRPGRRSRPTSSSGPGPATSC